MKRRDFLAGAAGAATLSAPAGAQPAKVVKFVPQADLALLDPVFTTGLVTRNHGFLVYDQLYGLDDSFNPQPQMVDGHVIEDDGKTWKLTLRDGLRFHDGTPVLARDAVASINRWTQTDAFGQTLRAATDELSAPSDRVIQFRLKKPFPLLPTALAKPSAFCPVMPERLANTPFNQQVTEMVGSGPFRYLANERVAGSRNVYAKFAEYVPRASGTASFAAGPKVVHIDRVEWVTLPDAATAAAALQAGEVDWWEQPQPDLLPLLRRNRNIRVEAKERGGLMGMIRFNHLVPPFDNPAIRRAFLAGVNQTEYMQAVMGEERSLWNDRCGFFLPGSPSGNEAGLEVMTGPRDLEKVKRDLQAAGYKGERVVFVVPTDLPSLNAMSLLAADMFRKVGINLDYQALDWGTVLPRLANREGLDRGGWSVWCNYIPGIIATSPATQSYARGIGRAGTFGWPESARLEALRDQYMDATDPAEQRRLCEEIQQQAWQDVPYIPTGAWMQPFAFRSNITGMLNGFPLFHNIRKG
ncbi:ABC transporter substrate-binding protein [Rhodovarius crocodyli]|uniref:ABC transporter substrate-binding protein n=1 Tax=Rhodovarius crocodyli TaxID=1979269 RepID=A0A437MLW9_9PROT|nr:ABC transporter substrate-binding protein [Rhodovarius crocodyli]RVT98606.1 ABC transporter substrate-binding protein [Rhodovarius crocodyli]